MMRTVALAVVTAFLVYQPIALPATVFTVDLVPTSSTTVSPGGSITYEMVGLLSGDASLGLAVWGIDLRSSYAIEDGLPQCEPGPDMSSFVRPDGVTNPAGYGGTPNGYDWLWQIGGAQNTIGNTIPPYPIGQVVLGIGMTPVVLATGVANLPSLPGEYQLEISTLFSAVITSGTGDPPPAIYHTAPATPVIGGATIDIIVLPEPATFSLLACGGLSLLRRHR